MSERRAKKKPRLSEMRECPVHGLTEFYGRNGGGASCVECTRAAMRHANMSEENKRRKAERQRRAAREHPEKRSARGAVARALKKGTLVRPEACECCGKVPPRTSNGRSGIQAAHHKGYAPEFWLDVRWLCHRCHLTIDSDLTPTQAASTL